VGRQVRIGFLARQYGRKAAADGAADDQSGKASRFKELALPHLDDAYTLARYLLPRADAEDAVQECYLRAFRHFDTFGGSAIKPWLLARARSRRMWKTAAVVPRIWRACATCKRLDRRVCVITLLNCCGAPQRAVRPSRREWLKGFGLGAGLSAIATSAAFVSIIRSDADQRILDDVVSSHLRSLEPEHLTDVLSSDRYTIKPWFNGRLDVAPPVVDLTAQGFTLIGGRLDAIGGKMVAAIVYRRRVHIINLFVTAAPAERHPAITETANGFNIRHWSDDGVSLWAISDINAEELEEFSDKFEAAIQKAT
jgi:anti-sigma factor RsiW